MFVQLSREKLQPLVAEALIVLDKILERCHTMGIREGSIGDTMQVLENMESMCEISTLISVTPEELDIFYLLLSEIKYGDVVGEKLKELVDGLKV